MDVARHPVGVLPLTVSVDGSDAALALRVDVSNKSGLVIEEESWI